MTNEFQRTDNERDPTSNPTPRLELVLDRMVDGELSVDEQRNLLIRCEEGGHWRDLALAYVESQVLDSTLNDSSFFSAEEQDPRRATKPGQQVERQQELDAQSRKTQENWNLMSLVAAVLLSLGLGYGLGWWWQGDASPMATQIAQDQGTSPGPSTPAVQNTKNQLETVPYYVSDAGNGKRQVALPIVDVSDLGPNWREQLQDTPLPDDVIREFRSKGMNVRHRRTMERVQLEDGRVMYVPIDYFYEELFP